MMKNKILFFFIILTGCGFSSGLYKDIIKAQDLISEQKYLQATRIYENILIKKPQKSIKIKVNFQLGEIYSIYLNDSKNALKNYNSIINYSNEPVWQVKALERIGDINLNSIKNYSESLKIYEKLISFEPKLKNHNFYFFKYSQSLLFLGEYKKSIEALTKVGNSFVESYYYKGLANFYLSHWDKAIESWYEYLKREKKHSKIVETKFLIANSYENQENLKKAYNIYYSLLGQYPNQKVLKNRLDSLYERRIARKR